MNEKLADQIQGSFLTFVDFLYAVVFGLVIVQLFDQALLTATPLSGKIGRTLIVAGVFYFLSWDWMHGRLLTLRNPYQKYRRFFIEILIAACGYGAARTALSGEPIFLLYIVGILLLGVWWAGKTRLEITESSDHHELEFLQLYQSIATLVVFWLYQYWVAHFQKQFEWRGHYF